jgi:copper chaperone
MEQYEFVVEGMSCTGCEATVSNAIRRVEGVHRVEADHETGAVVITADAGTESDVKQAIHDAGYDIPA